MRKMDIKSFLIHEHITEYPNITEIKKIKKNYEIKSTGSLRLRISNSSLSLLFRNKITSMDITTVARRIFPMNIYEHEDEKITNLIKKKTVH